jgi:PHP family Zn ribbon phosphoesterase
MRHKEFGKMKVICKKCGTKFIRKSKYEHQCNECWSKARTGFSSLVCFECDSSINPKEETIKFMSFKYSKFQPTKISKVMFNFHRSCFNKFFKRGVK